MKFLVLALFVAAAVASPIPEDNSDAVELIVNGVPEGSPLELGGIVDMHLNEHVNGQLAASSNLLHPYTAVGIAEAAAVAENAPALESDYHIKPEAILLPAPVVPESVVLPEPVAPEVLPSPIVLPTPVIPQVVPESVVLPEPVAPEVLPSPIVLPSPVAPEVVPESVVLPEPVAPEVLPAPIVLPSPVAPEVVPELPESVVLPAPVPPMVIPEPESIVMPAPEPPMVIAELPEPIPSPAAQGPGEIYNDGLVQVQVNAPQDAGMFATLQNWFSLVVNYISNGIQTSQQIV